MAALGGFGAAMFLAGVVVWSRVLRGPDDGNPVAMLGAVTTGLALFPAWGLVLAVRRGDPEDHLGWLFTSVVTGALLLLLLPIVSTVMG